MAGDANLRFVRAVIAVERELVVAIVALLNVNYRASGHGICVRDRRVEHGVGDGDTLERTVVIYIYGRMTFDGDRSRCPLAVAGIAVGDVTVNVPSPLFTDAPPQAASGFIEIGIRRAGCRCRCS